MVSDGRGGPWPPTACSAGSSPARSRPTRVHEDDLVIAIRDIAPRAPTHILLIPRRHIASAADLTEADGPMLGRLFAVAAELARERGHRRRRATGSSRTSAAGAARRSTTCTST